MKMHYIETDGYPEWNKDCLCKDKYGEYVVACPYINSGKFQFWEYTEEFVDRDDIEAWIYIDELNLE